MDFYDVHEQTKYEITVSKPKKPEDLSDLFMTEEELKDLVGRNFYMYDKQRTIILSGVVTTEVVKWANKLEASGKKTLRIDDDELLVVLKKGPLSDYTDDNATYGRHGNRICFARQYKRKKTKVSQSDVSMLWSHLVSGFYDRFRVWPTHIPRYERSIGMFKAFKEIVGWRRVRSHMHDKATVKFLRQIWDNPEEHIK